jgi:RHS repeat-associated protein
VTTTHVWNGANIVLELNTNGNVINAFTRDARGNLIRSTQHGFYLFNARGDVVQRVNAQGVVVHIYWYDAFGNELNEDSRNTNPFRFASMYWDSHTGTYMTPNRHFNPRTGRWTQPDPFWGIHNMQSGSNAIMQSANLYVFTMHNPVRWVDPTGLIAKTAQQKSNIASVIRAYQGGFVTREQKYANIALNTPGATMTNGNSGTSTPPGNGSTASGLAGFNQVGTSGPILFYLFGTDQQSHAMRNINHLSRRFQVFYAYIPTPADFAATWNRMIGNIDILVVNVHSAPDWSEYFTIGDLNHRTIDTFLFLGCNAAHQDVPNNLANQFLENHRINQLVAVDGNHLRAPAPFRGIGSSPGPWFNHFAGSVPDLLGEGMMSMRSPMGFMLHRDGKVTTIGYSFVSVNRLLTRVGR